jgi:hypothetical protein
MAKSSKVISTKKLVGGGHQGGSGHMFSKQSAGSVKPGKTGKTGFGGGKFAKGGSGHMFGKQSVKPSKSGTTGKSG